MPKTLPLHRFQDGLGYRGRNQDEGSMNHRRDIDGLRAVAARPVILVHAGFAPFSGGFVGFDLFLSSSVFSSRP